MAGDEVLERLDRLQATLALAFAPQLAEASEEIRADAISAAILDATEDWTPSTNLQAAVVKTTGRTTRAVRDRLPQLVSRGALDTRGSERKLEYRRTGLV